MSKNFLTYITSIALLPVLAFSSSLWAHPPHYRLIDMGTFGGPQSYLSNGDGVTSVTVLNNRGALAGAADTAIPDFDAPLCFNPDCFVSHAFRFDAGGRIDLGPLVAGRNSFADYVSPNGLIVGFAENGAFDPLVPAFTEIRAVLWHKGGITDLGTLPEGGYESQANAVNDKGQVVGWATNTVPDSFSMIGAGLLVTQFRAFLWENGAMRDLGTLGTGTDAIAQFINERGQVVGWSYTGEAGTCIVPGPFPTPLAVHSFIWDEEKGMRDLGTVGGIDCVFATGLNARGEVIGNYVTAQPLQRAFLWKDGLIQDLGGTIGGQQTGAESVNDSGAVAGLATLAGEALFHATLWKRVGEITDLGTLRPNDCSFATSLNARTEVVGGSASDCFGNGNSNARAFLWHDGTLYDLNALIAPGASLILQIAENVNDRGEIAGTGADVLGNQHAFLLVPCRDDDASYCQETIAATPAPGEAVVVQRTTAATSTSTHQLRYRLRLPHLPLAISLPSAP